MLSYTEFPLENEPGEEILDEDREEMRLQEKLKVCKRAYRCTQLRPRMVGLLKKMGGELTLMTLKMALSSGLHVVKDLRMVYTDPTNRLICVLCWVSSTEPLVLFFRFYNTFNAWFIHPPDSTSSHLFLILSTFNACFTSAGLPSPTRNLLYCVFSFTIYSMQLTSA